MRTELSYCISNTCLLLPVHVNFVKEKTEVRKPDIVWKTKEKESERDRKRGGGMCKLSKHTGKEEQSRSVRAIKNGEE